MTLVARYYSLFSCKPFNTESPESRKWKKINIQKASPGIGPVRYDIICGISGKSFTQINKDLYVDAMMLVSLSFVFEFS